MKRAFDLLLTIPAIVILAPIFLLLFIMIRFKLGSPVLFKQQRPGLHGRPFIMYKFRTMTNQRDDSGALLPDSERLTAFGRLLRSTSLDELPELWNVVKGDMSLVGPRPLLMEYLPLYSKEQFRRHEMRPGITGWAQINGRNAIDWPTRFKLDLWYVDNRSLLLDLRILFITFIKVFRRQGITQPGESTMTKFTGGHADV
ncbi:MAG: sugar transferase [Permianibacter sp.]